MDANTLIAEAKHRTGLSDFGGDYFVEPMNRLIASINEESALTPLGAAVFNEILAGRLASRLMIEECYRQHPEIENEEIVAPTFIVGLPRTGSTALGHMLALDPDTRSLRVWESQQPCPPPEKETEDTDPRIAVAQEGARQLEEMAPGIKLAIPRDKIGIDECFTLLELSFASSAFDGFIHTPSYLAWVRKPEFDWVPAYRYHKRVLKLLQWHCPPRRWQLRSPVHSYAIGALGTVYPDARFIMTHRDPVKVIPSVANLMHQLRNKYLVDSHPRWLGPALTNGWSTALKRVVDFRDKVGEGRFFDIAHRDQIKDPIPQIRALYDWLGWRFEESFEARIRQWQQENPKGDHRPDPDFFAVDPDDIRQKFKFYTDRFARLI